MKQTRTSRLAWRAVRYAVGLPTFICEVCLAAAAAIWFVKSATLQDQAVTGFLFCFFAGQAYFIWRILLRTSDAARTQELKAKLSEMDARSLEFYCTVREYFAKRAHWNRACGLFFLSLGILSLVFLVMTWPQNPISILVVGAEYLFCGFIGLPAFHHASTILNYLPQNVEGTNECLLRLRIVALLNRGDPVAILVRRLIEERTPPRCAD